MQGSLTILYNFFSCWRICLGKTFNNNVKICKLNFCIMIESVEKYSAKGHMNNEWFLFIFCSTFIITCRACEVVYVWCGYWLKIWNLGYFWFWRIMMFLELLYIQEQDFFKPFHPTNLERESYILACK
jgi:hypothetical protein